MLFFATKKTLLRAYCLVLLVALFSSGTAFVPTTTSLSRRSSASITKPASTTTSLSERRWNFNEGQSPWGLKKNAEIWNGRVAQMSFIVVVLQELITGKGAIEGVQEGNPVNIACLAVTVASILGLTAFLAMKGDDKYVDKALGRK